MCTMFRTGKFVFWLKAKQNGKDLQYFAWVARCQDPPKTVWYYRAASEKNGGRRNCASACAAALQLALPQPLLALNVLKARSQPVDCCEVLDELQSLEQQRRESNRKVDARESAGRFGGQGFSAEDDVPNFTEPLSCRTTRAYSVTCAMVSPDLPDEIQKPLEPFRGVRSSCETAETCCNSRNHPQA